MMPPPHDSPQAAEPPGDAQPRELLQALYWAGVHAAAPGPSLRAALERRPARFARQVWLVALGKAAYPMATAAVAELKARGAEPAGGIVIAQGVHTPPHPRIECVQGDHPVPGAHSAQAAARLEALTRRVGQDDDAWVLLSGGASSLASAPVQGIDMDALKALNTLLLGSGLAITPMNRIRKRFMRWGAGRLALALKRAQIHQFVISDVIGDDLAIIGSGPCVPDDTTAAGVRDALVQAGLWDRTPASMQRFLRAAMEDPRLETPKPDHPVFDRVETEIIASNRIALQAIARDATARGYTPRLMPDPLVGEAAQAGRAIAEALAGECAAVASAASARGKPRCVIWGGETTVTLDRTAPDTGGGRCQELALSAAQQLELHERGPEPLALLAAGTDGRDGPSDAAGAIITPQSWDAIRRAGRDPARDLAAHASHAALDAAGALFRTGLTETNVMDVVIGICGLAAR
ncbi:MAG TPA: DUF4147 domain-containing protein [Gemmatimonadaceae bacterium]|nr:DUF4147 domain-containing protein [Gemmatimonadaceae bacterium]